MARTIRHSELETRSARARLEARAEPYWRTIERGLHLGYYKGQRGGSWLARRYRAGAYEKKALGKADDNLDTNGISILSFYEAQAQARQWYDERVRHDAGIETASGPYSVRDAMRDYLAAYERRSGKSLGAMKNASNLHVLPALGEIEVAKLTSRKVRDWHHSLAAAPARARRGRNGKINYREVRDDPDTTRRKRQATANRVLTVLKAALNHAWQEGIVANDEAWRRVKPFRNVDAPVIRYLTGAECKRLVNACPNDFREIVRAALFTGCRYGELAALRAADFNPDAGTLTVRTSKSGKSRHVVLTDEAERFFVGITAGREGTQRMLIRADGEPWGKMHQQRRLADACKKAKIAPAISFHVLRHTHGSLLAMQGAPTPVIARQLGHADTRVTERHYAHLAPDYVADTIRNHFPTLGIGKPGKVVALRKKTAA